MAWVNGKIGQLRVTRIWITTAWEIIEVFNYIIQEDSSYILLEDWWKFVLEHN